MFRVGPFAFWGGYQIEGPVCYAVCRREESKKMNRSNYYISLDIRDSYGACLLDMKQADTHRRLHITLTDGGSPYLLTPGCYPVFTAKRPDGSGIFNACAVEDNTVIYDITLQDTAAVGLLRCELRLYDGALELDQNGIPEIRDENIQLLTCAAFGIRVHPTVYDDSDIPASGDELTALTKTLADARSTIQAVLDAKNSGQFNGPQGEQGPQGEKGDTGAPGLDGYTPVRGIDYWTEEDQKQFDAALAKKAEIQNDTIGPDAWSSKAIIDRLCPGFTESGNLAQCQPVEGYPLEVASQITPSLEGTTQLTLTQLGKNLLSFSVWYENAYLMHKIGGGTNNGNTFITKYIPCAHLRGQTLTLNHSTAKHQGQTGTNMGMAFYTDIDTTTSGLYHNGEATYISGTNADTFIVPDNANYMRFTIYEAYENETQLELGSTTTDFESYTEKSYTADFGSPVYGGSFDWSTGELTMTHKAVELRDLNWRYSSPNLCFLADLPDPTAGAALCNIFTHAPGRYMDIETGGYVNHLSFDIDPEEKSIVVSFLDYGAYGYEDEKALQEFLKYLESENAVLVYPVAEPVVQSVANTQQVTAKCGTNTLYSSTGSTRVSGKSDPVTVIETLSTRLAALEDAAI